MVEPNPSAAPPPNGQPRRGMRGWVKHFDDLIWAPTEGARRGLGFVQRWIQIIERSLAGFLKGRGASAASGLTYTTLLTLVPLLAIVIPTLKAFGVYDNAHQAIMRVVDGTLPSTDSTEKYPELGDAIAQRQTQELQTTDTLMRERLQPPADPFQSALTFSYAFLPYPESGSREADTVAARLETALQNGIEFTSATRQVGFGNPEGPITVQRGNPRFSPELYNYLASLGVGGTSVTIPGRNGWLAFQMINRADPLRESIYEFIDRVFAIVDNTNLKNLGYFGLAGLLWAVMSLLSKIERAMNDAWAIHRSRPWGRKIFDYMNLIVIFVLLLMALSATTTGGIIQISGAWQKFHINEAQEFLLKLLPFIVVWAAFITLYRFMPNTHVRWTSAFTGGIVAGSLFQLAQIALFRTHLLVDRYNKIYGVFAVLVLVIVIIYFSWCIVLWGMWVCSVHQNLRDWRRRRRPWMNTPAERETLALRLAVLLAGPLLDANETARMDSGELADALGLPPLPVSEMIELFREQGLAVQTAEDGGWLLARSPEELSALDVLRLVRHGGTEVAVIANPLLEGSEEILRAPLQKLTIKRLTTMPLDQIQTITL